MHLPFLAIYAYIYATTTMPGVQGKLPIHRYEVVGVLHNGLDHTLHLCNGKQRFEEEGKAKEEEGDTHAHTQTHKHKHIHTYNRWGEILNTIAGENGSG